MSAAAARCRNLLLRLIGGGKTAQKCINPGFTGTFGEDKHLPDRLSGSEAILPKSSGSHCSYLFYFFFSRNCELNAAFRDSEGRKFRVECVFCRNAAGTGALAPPLNAESGILP